MQLSCYGIIADKMLPQDFTLSPYRCQLLHPNPVPVPVSVLDPPAMFEQCCQRFWHNYFAAKDALRVFLSMRIKRLLKFIDITDSIKLCLPHHHTLLLP